MPPLAQNISSTRSQTEEGRACLLLAHRGNWPIYNERGKGAPGIPARGEVGTKMGDLQGRIAMVTGAAQGIGRAIAEELAAAGATLVLADMNEAKLNETAAELAAKGSTAAAFTMNVSDQDSIEAGAKAILEKFGKVEILINNAGITRDNLMLRMKRSEWDSVISINLTGAFLLTQALLSPMLKNRWGRIVNIASVVGRAGQAGQVNYAASKAGIIGLTKSLAREVASRNITVNAVAPGYIETPMTAVLSEEVTKAMLATVPLGRRGTPKDVAQAVKFLASDAASYITGHVLDVNGGMFMGG
jgi:3-oxoacyl-[acyl-carrier protein] reductase